MNQNPQSALKKFQRNQHYQICMTSGLGSPQSGSLLQGVLELMVPSLFYHTFRGPLTEDHYFSRDWTIYQLPLNLENQIQGTGHQ